MDKRLCVALLFMQALLQVLAVHDSAVCSEQLAGCIVPQPLLAVRESSLNEVVVDIQCEIGCINEHGGVSLPPVNGDSLWPSVDFDALKLDCPLYQKIYECKMGCKTHHSSPSLTVNRCRDACYSNCEKDDCTGQPCDSMPCGRFCRKPYCRVGCMTYDLLNTVNKTHNSHPPLPSPPSVVKIIDGSQSHRYSVRPSLGSASLVAVESIPTTAYVVKISSPHRNHVNYLWQRNISVPVDLSAYACQEVLLSYAVVSTHTPTDGRLSALPFSPETTVCVPGLGGRPSKVPSVSVHYTEDTRLHFFSYAVANVSWRKPQEGSQYVTSYTLKIHPDRESCGGSNAIYQYRNIDKDATYFTVEAKDPTGLLKFGCHYIFEVIALPPIKVIGTYINSLVEAQGPHPQMVVNCERVWNQTSGNFNISVQWSLSPFGSPSSHINRFNVTSVLQERNGGVLHTYPSLTVTPQEGESQFHTSLSTFTPQSDKEYTIEINVDRNSAYFWRPRLSPGSCTVVTDPRPSDIPSNISVSSTFFDSRQNSVRFELSWGVPRSSYGDVVRYEVQVVTDVGGASNDSESGLQWRDVQNFTADTYTATVTSQLPTNLRNTHCAYVQIRTVNSFSAVGEWSEPLVLALDDRCLVDTGRISLFYETKDIGNVRLLELDCDSDSALFGGDTQSKVAQNIREIKESVSTMQANDEVTKKRMGLLEQKVADIDEKLGALLQLLANHVYVTPSP